MTESYIRKIQPDADGLDFESLRRDGIELVQKFSGDVWSDYNLHDPGVTILEVLCYALTDMSFRAGFGAADYLTDENGKIDFGRQALFRPDRIFPSRPLTINDYRKLILNAVPNTDNVWIKRHPAQTGDAEGLYSIYVQLNERVKNQSEAGVRKAYADIVEKIYAANRNLCEDLAGVEIVERIPYSLGGEIEVDGKREAASILAEIYFECSQYLSPRVAIRSYAEMYRNGLDLEELFAGVLTEHGYIAEEELHSWRGHFSIAELSGRIARIDGVRNIKDLHFIRDGKKTDSITLGGAHATLPVASLRLPATDGEVAILLHKSGKPLRGAVQDIETEFARRDYKFQAHRNLRQKFDWVDAILPSGEYRNIGEYYSIQNHFPNIYGLNAFGVPESASPKRKSQAAQLKAYLLFFEQLMANFLQNAQHIPDLFSLDETLRLSCFYQVLGNDIVPGVEKIYRGGKAGMEQQLAGLMSGFDNYGDRRNRVLDYLLALYGEKLSGNSLRQFFAEDADIDETRIANKITFLKQMADIGKNRAGAINYRKPAHPDQNTSGLQQKLKMLLGLNADDTRDGGEMHIVEHILLRPRGVSGHAGHRVPLGFYSFRISIIFPACCGNFSGEEFRRLARETVYLNCPAHILPEMRWLDQEQMQQFNILHDKWLAERRGDSLQSADAAAGELIFFLRATGGEK